MNARALFLVAFLFWPACAREKTGDEYEAIIRACATPCEAYHANVGGFHHEGEDGGIVCDCVTKK
jgi:hypothetical protein